MKKSQAKRAELARQEARALESLKHSLAKIINEDSVDEHSPVSVKWPVGDGESERKVFSDIYEALKAVATRLREISKEQAAEQKMREQAEKKAHAEEKAWTAGFIGRWAQAPAAEQKRGILSLLSFAGRCIKVGGKNYSAQAQLVGDIALSLWAKGEPVEKLAAKFPQCGERLSLSFFLSRHAADKLEALSDAGALSWREWEGAMPGQSKPWSNKIYVGKKIEDHLHSWVIWVEYLFAQHEYNQKTGSPGLRAELKILEQLSGFAKRSPECKNALTSWADEASKEIKRMANDPMNSCASMGSTKKAIEVAIKCLDIAETKPFFLEAAEEIEERLKIEDKCWSWVAALRGAIEVDGVVAARMIVKEIQKISPRGLGSYHIQDGGLLRIAAKAGAVNCLQMLLDEGTPVLIASTPRGEPKGGLSPLPDAMRLALGKMSGIDEALGRKILGRMCMKWRDQLMAERGIDAGEAAQVVEDHLRKSTSQESARSAKNASLVEAEIISQAINLCSQPSLDDELLKPRRAAMRL